MRAWPTSSHINSPKNNDPVYCHRSDRGKSRLPSNLRGAAHIRKQFATLQLPMHVEVAVLQASGKPIA